MGSVTGKFLSEALILGSTNPQYDKRLFIDLPVQYMKTASASEKDLPVENHFLQFCDWLELFSSVLFGH